MSMLIDSLIERKTNFKVYQYWDGDFVLKPYFHRRPSLINRIINAWRVLTGKSFAVHYFEDHDYEYINRRTFKQ